MSIRALVPAFSLISLNVYPFSSHLSSPLEMQLHLFFFYSLLSSSVYLSLSHQLDSAFFFVTFCITPWEIMVRWMKKLKKGDAPYSSSCPRSLFIFIITLAAIQILHWKVHSINYFSEHQLSFHFILRLLLSGRAHTKACREKTLSDLCTHQRDGRQAVLLWSLALGGSKSLNKQRIPLEEWKCFLLFKKKTNKPTNKQKSNNLFCSSLQEGQTIHSPASYICKVRNKLTGWLF